MNKTYKLSALWMMCLMLLGSVSFTACLSEDDVNTNQYKGGVDLNVFGPSPVARGGILRFLGSGLDKVTGVEIPGCDVISDIELVSASEIRVTVPQTAMPGFVTLKTANGTIVTKTKLTYTEPISLEKFAPATVKPGSMLTIEGEYLNLIKEVIFADNVIVAQVDFTSQDRKQIKLIIPEEAQSGKFILSDAAEIPNWIYSDEELKIVLPSVEAPLDLTGKKPGDEIVVKGKDLDLVKTMKMPNGDELEFVYAKSEEGVETITFILPENASDGAVVMIPASGVEVAIANIGMALPSEVKATPAEGLLGGDVITLTGINMELVTTITFLGVEEAVEPISKSATEVKVGMPATAISGDLLLNTASGASVPVTIATLKPEFMSFANDAVSLGSDVTIQGKNLDLVTKVIYTGGTEVEVTPASATELTVSMPTMGTESGVLTLVMGNGETVETGSLTINAPEFCYIPVLPGEDKELKGGEIFTIAVENGDKLTGVEVDGKAVQYIINDNTLVIAVPQLANANTKVKLISSNGTVEYPIAFIPATNIKNEVWKGLIDITWKEGGRVIIPASAFKDVPAGARMVLHYAQKDQTWAQAQINYGDFTVINFTEGEVKFKGTLTPTDVYGWKFENRSTPLVLTQEILDNIQAKQGECEGIENVGIIIQGSDLIFSSVTLEWEISLETSIWNGEFNVGNWSGNQDLAWAGYDWSSVKAGQVLTFYFTQNDWDEGYWQLSLRHGAGWGNINSADCPKQVDLDAGATSYSIMLTQSILDDLIANGGLVVTGKEITLHKITIL